MNEPAAQSRKSAGGIFHASLMKTLALQQLTIEGECAALLFPPPGDSSRK